MQDKYEFLVCGASQQPRHVLISPYHCFPRLPSANSPCQATSLDVQKVLDVPQGQTTILAATNRLLEQGFGAKGRCSIVDQAAYDPECFKNAKLIRSCYERLLKMQELGAAGIRRERISHIRSALAWKPLLPSTVNVDAACQHDAYVLENERVSMQVQAQLVSNREKGSDGELRKDGDEIIDRSVMIGAAYSQAAKTASDTVGFELYYHYHHNYYFFCLRRKRSNEIKRKLPDKGLRQELHSMRAETSESLLQRCILFPLSYIYEHLIVMKSISGFFVQTGGNSQTKATASSTDDCCTESCSVY